MTRCLYSENSSRNDDLFAYDGMTDNDQDRNDIQGGKHILKHEKLEEYVKKMLPAKNNATNQNLSFEIVSSIKPICVWEQKNLKATEHHQIFLHIAGDWETAQTREHTRKWYVGELSAWDGEKTRFTTLQKNIMYCLCASSVSFSQKKRFHKMETRPEFFGQQKNMVSETSTSFANS